MNESDYTTLAQSCIPPGVTPEQLTGPSIPIVVLTLLSEPGQIVELRLLRVHLKGQRVPLTMNGYFDDHAVLTKAAATYGPSLSRLGDSIVDTEVRHVRPFRLIFERQYQEASL